MYKAFLVFFLTIAPGVLLGLALGASINLIGMAAFASLIIVSFPALYFELASRMSLRWAVLWFLVAFTCPPIYFYFYYNPIVCS